MSRLVFSDGRTDITLELFLPLTDGTNPLLIGNDFVVEVEKMTPEEGVYLKWLNNLGGWTYWLLSCIYSEEDKRKLIGQLENDFSNLDQTTSPLLSLGIDTQTKISGTTNFLNAKENETFKSIFQSPKVYLFTGERFSKNKFNDWIEVQIGNQNITTKNLKQKEVVYSIDINLPKNNTMKL